MRARAARRHLPLLIAVGVPCVCLIVLGAMLIKNGRELARSRVAEDRQRRVAAVGRELMTTLERIKLEEAGSLVATAHENSGLGDKPRNPNLALIGWVRDGHLVLPWEDDPRVARFSRLLHGTPAGQAIAQGEHQEVVARQFETAIKLYEWAQTLTSDPVERDYAKLLAARATVKRACECTAYARKLFLSLLDSGSTDDQAVPLALYAAEQLLNARLDSSRVLDMLEREQKQQWAAPASLYLQRALLENLQRHATDSVQRNRATQLSAQLTSLIDDAEQAIALQRDLPTFLPAAGVRDARTNPVWRPYGGRSWLVSDSTPLGGLPAFVIAVRAMPAFDAINRANRVATAATGALKFSTDGLAGDPVGPEFPGLRLAFAESDSERVMGDWRIQRTFYLLAVVSVVGLTAVVGFVFWRDIRRELEIADLRSQFVASVSHELRTPLTAIRMFAETLQLERPLSASARAEYLNTIVSESERLTRLINNVLDYSKIERGQKVYRLYPGSVAAVVRAAAGAMQYPLAQQGFDLRVELSDDLPLVRLDEDAIQQAVLNLLTNAMKYSREKREIDVRVAGVDGAAVIEVKDYGVGIPSHEQSRIFDRFYRIAGPENARIPGAGLGLALVDHIVKGHGGSVKVHSTPGEGSTFAIHLPVEPAA